MPDAIRRSQRRTSTIYGALSLGKGKRRRIEKAKEHFLKAIDLDASYALAYSGLADTYTLAGQRWVLPMSEAYPLGRAAALKALELDERSGKRTIRWPRSPPITTGIGPKPADISRAPSG